MATLEEANQAIIDQIAEVANGRLNPGSKATIILRYAEALAWLKVPAQPHGSRPSSE